MKTYKLFAIIIACAASLAANAQIGYQVSLLNSATGEPRANETVSVTIDITNSENTSIYQGTQTATTNDFGVLSLQVGNATTFENIDWSKLPLYVSVTVDGVMVGRSQILNVPVAEAAKTLVNVAPELICKTWTGQFNCRNNSCSTITFTLFSNKTFSYNINEESYISSGSGKYIVQGNLILLCSSSAQLYCLPTNLVYNEGSIYVQFNHLYLELH